MGVMTTSTHAHDDIILMAHGGGGALTRKIIDELILVELGNPILNKLDDGACLSIPESELVLTTDSYVVDPVFFPGGDIGRLAVSGTINDLAMQGAEPRYMSLGLIIEEGFPIRDLKRIIRSVKNVSEETGVLIVTGDTKVIGRVQGSAQPPESFRQNEQNGVQGFRVQDERKGGIFINTTGLGVRRPGVDVAVSNALPGDTVIITGSMGDHGMAVMNIREGLQLESQLLSDVAPLWNMIGHLLETVGSIHCLRDPTRGGVAAALCDIADASSCGIRIRESVLPVKDEVKGACSILGLDPLNVANEGKALVVCDGSDADRVLEVLHSHPLSREARVIGKVVAEQAGVVLLETKIGGERIVDVPMGEDLPRIC